jgi:hypothetical protein
MLLYIANEACNAQLLVKRVAMHVLLPIHLPSDFQWAAVSQSMGRLPHALHN